MKNWLIVAALAVGGVARAADPLEQASLDQVAAQAPGSAQVGPFFRGAEKGDQNRNQDLCRTTRHQPLRELVGQA